MKTRLLVSLALAAISTSLWGAERILPINLQGPGANYEANLPEGFQRLALGDAPPDFNLIGVDDKFHSLAEYKGGKVLMVVFLSNHCPYSHAQEVRMIPVVNKYMSQGLKVVSIQPNTPLAENGTGLAYSKYNDSFEEMKLYAKENHFTFDYLYDGDTQLTTKAFGALATPHVYLFDKDLKLRYAGRWDDGRYEEVESVSHSEGRDALDAMMAGKPVAVPFTKPLGCATKWNGPDEGAALPFVPTAWRHDPITLGTIDAAGVSALVKNNTKKIRVFNVWSTKSLTSLDKMNVFAQWAQRLDRRDFEVITLSLDTEANHANALKFLQEQHVGWPPRIREIMKKEGRETNNYRFNGTNVSDLAKALDAKWPGAPLPHTVVIAPGGEVMWRYTGSGFDQAEPRRMIIGKLGGMFENDGRVEEMAALAKQFKGPEGATKKKKKTSGNGEGPDRAPAPGK